MRRSVTMSAAHRLLVSARAAPTEGFGRSAVILSATVRYPFSRGGLHRKGTRIWTNEHESDRALVWGSQ